MFVQLLLHNTGKVRENFALFFAALSADSAQSAVDFLQVFLTQ